MIRKIIKIDENKLSQILGVIVIKISALKETGIEEFKANSFCEWITSITASAFARSILPFKKALFVNSPGSAILAPF